MKHLIGFYASVANSATNSTLTPVADTILPTIGNRLSISDKIKIRRALLQGITTTEGRINVPTLRAITLPRLYPVNKALYAVDNPPVLEWDDYGPEVLPGEGIGVDVTTTTGGSNPDATHALLWIGNELAPPPKLPIFTMKASLSVTVATGSWVNGTPTFENDLGAGRYAIVGAEIYGAGVVASRFVFPGAVYRPGIMGQQAAGEFDQGSQRFGKMGVFGEFTNLALPTVDVLGVTGAASQTMYLDLMKIA